MTMTIKLFTRGIAIALQQEIEKAIRPIAEKHGATLTAKGSFTTDRLNLRFTVALAGSADAPSSDGGLAAHGITNPNFQHEGKAYRAVEYVENRHKYPVTAERVSDGKRFKFPLDALGAQGESGNAKPPGKAAGWLYRPAPEPAGSTSAAMLKLSEDNWNALDSIDKAAKEAGQVLYRYITHPFADGNAVYQIVGVDEARKRATISVVTGIGDDWVLPAWGARKTIRLSEAKEFLRRRDGLAALFSRSSA